MLKSSIVSAVVGGLCSTVVLAQSVVPSSSTPAPIINAPANLAPAVAAPTTVVPGAAAAPVVIAPGGALLQPSAPTGAATAPGTIRSSGPTGIVQPGAFAPGGVPANGPGAGVIPRSNNMMTPLAVVLRKTTPVEEEANAVWNVRAALNIAALQCQFSGFLATVRNYNDVLRQHSQEFDRAKTIMTAHFRRYDGKQAQNNFDRYVTQTYNSYSTLDAQLAFCEQAAVAGRSALLARKGELGKRAKTITDGIRASLVPIAMKSLLIPFEITPEALPPL